MLLARFKATPYFGLGVRGIFDQLIPSPGKIKIYTLGVQKIKINVDIQLDHLPLMQYREDWCSCWFVATVPVQRSTSS